MKIKDLYIGDWFYIGDKVANIAYFINSTEGYFCFYSTNPYYASGYKYNLNPSLEINYLPIIKQDWWREDAMLLFSYDETNTVPNNTYARAGQVIMIYNESNFDDYHLCLTRASSTAEPTYKGIVLYSHLIDKRGEQIILDKDKLVLKSTHYIPPDLYIDKGA